MSTPFIRLKELTKIYSLGVLGKKKIVAVDRVSFDIRSGEILSVLGESGSGKSTIAKMVLRLLKPSGGNIVMYTSERAIDPWNLRKWSEIKEYFRRVQGVFQDPYASFNPRRKVLDVLYDTVRNFFPELKDNPTAAKTMISDVLEGLGLRIQDLEGKYPHQLSGGQLQRVSIARALLPKPQFIIADEPVSMVDASTRIDILNIFINLKKEYGVTPVVITHDYSLAHYASDRIVVLYRGQLMEEGPPEVLEEPNHPYTKLLKESVPLIDRTWGAKLKYSAGSIDITKRTKGCVFADRCPFKRQICEVKEPPLIDLGRVKVKCWLYA